MGIHSTDPNHPGNVSRRIDEQQDIISKLINKAQLTGEVQNVTINESDTDTISMLEERLKQAEIAVDYSNFPCGTKRLYRIVCEWEENYTIDYFDDELNDLLMESGEKPD